MCSYAMAMLSLVLAVAAVVAGIMLQLLIIIMQ